MQGSAIFNCTAERDAVCRCCY